MKAFEPYKAIRQKAMILGLPLTYFALQMIAVIGSLMVIIFSFSLGIIIAAILCNGGLYVGLTQMTRHPELFYLKKVFPDTISSKFLSLLHDEENKFE